MSSYVKELRDSRAAQSSKLRKLGAQGSLKMARAGEHAPRKYNDDRARYADGGAVGDIGGMASKPRLDRPGRKMGKAKGKKDAKTNINVIIAGKPDAGAPKPDMGMPPPGAMAGPPPGPPGPPMRASGGRIGNLGKYAHGGKVKRADGGWTGEGDSGKAKKEESADLNKKSSDAASAAKSDAASGAMSAGARLAMAGPGPAGKIYKGLKLANTLFAGSSGASALGNAARATTLGKEAASANKAGDEAEGKKKGGAVKRKC